jgi:hypothetical protein
VRALALLVALIALAAVAPATAAADGDPASDVLLIQNVYVPYRLPSPATERLVDRAVNESFAAKYPIQVAIIRERADLGAVPDFFGRPQEYAKFLYAELRKITPPHPAAAPRQVTASGARVKVQPGRATPAGQITRPPDAGLLVVMPAGYGVAGPPKAQAAALRKLSVSSGADSDELARDAVYGVQALAGAGGHPVPEVLRPPDPSSSGVSSGTVVLAVEILLTLAAIALGLWWRTRRRVTDPEGTGSASAA